MAMPQIVPSVRGRWYLAKVVRHVMNAATVNAVNWMIFSSNV